MFALKGAAWNKFQLISNLLVFFFTFFIVFLCEGSKEQTKENLKKNENDFAKIFSIYTAYTHSVYARVCMCVYTVYFLGI